MQRYMSGFNLHTYCIVYTVYLAQKQDIFCCIRSNRGRPGFYTEIQNIFGTVRMLSWQHFLDFQGKRVDENFRFLDITALSEDLQFQLQLLIKKIYRKKLSTNIITAKIKLFFTLVRYTFNNNFRCFKIQFLDIRMSPLRGSAYYRIAILLYLSTVFSKLSTASTGNEMKKVIFIPSYNFHVLQHNNNKVFLISFQSKYAKIKFLQLDLKIAK